MYKKYFILGGRDKGILEKFIQYLYFWGPDFDDVVRLIKSNMKDMNWNKIKCIINKIEY